MPDSIISYNDKLRLQVVDNIEQLMIDEYLSEDEAIRELALPLYRSFDSQGILIEFFKCCLCGLFYLDAYKMLSYKVKKGISVGLELENFKRVYDIIDYDDLYSETFSDPNFFCMLIRECSHFTSLNYFGKTLVMHSLSEEENNQLSAIAPLHEEDLDYYKRTITTEKLIEFLKIDKEDQIKNKGIDFLEGFVYNLIGFLKELVIYDKENADNLIREIARIDYETSRYIAQNIENGFSISDRIRFYELNDEETIINTMYHNQDFLFDACEMFINRTINGEYKEHSLHDISSSDESPVIKKLTKK